MSMNLPPQFADLALAARMWRDITDLQANGSLSLLMRYVEAGGAAPDRAAGAYWLSRRLPLITAERVLVAPGAQSSLLALTTLLASPGDTILVEALTYPGFRALAAHLRIQLVGLAMDQEGIDPDAFAAACRHHKPKALYCTPTHHNPTTATMSAVRRNAIAAVARRHGVTIIEDDAYGFVPGAALPPIAALGPELTYYVATLAKCLSPALRIAYLAAPDLRKAGCAAAALRATAAMASPLTAAVATRWIEDGTAEAVLSAIRAEAMARSARRHAFYLPMSSPPSLRAFTCGFRSMLPGREASLPAGSGLPVSAWLSVMPFAASKPPEAVRISLGVAPTRTDVIRGLEAIAVSSLEISSPIVNGGLTDACKRPFEARAAEG